MNWEEFCGHTVGELLDLETIDEERRKFDFQFPAALARLQVLNMNRDTHKHAMPFTLEDIDPQFATTPPEERQRAADANSRAKAAEIFGIFAKRFPMPKTG